MQIDPEELRRHYAMLSDEALHAIKRDELTPLAKPIYDQELARREAEADPDAAYVADDGELEEELDLEAGPEPDWLEDAACACAFAMPSQARMTDIPMSAKARSVLHAANIPCHLIMSEEDPPQLRLMVPGGLALHATSILDRDIFNEEQEAEFRAALEVLSDAELRALNPKIFCAGLLDRVDRLTRSYTDEVTRRKIAPRGL